MTYFKLNNGLKIVLVDDKHYPKITSRLIFKAGAKNENHTLTGLAHFCEHLCFEGSKNMSKGKFDEVVTNNGGHSNASTSQDLTIYKLDMPIECLELILWLESERWKYISITDEAMLNQKSVIEEEIKQTKLGKPYSIWYDTMISICYQENTPYSWSVAGSIEHVHNANKNDVESFIHQNYVPEKSVLALGGNIDVAKTTELISKYFNVNNNSNIHPEIKISPVFGNSIEVYDNVPTEALYVSFHYDGIANEKESTIAEVISYIFSSGNSAIFKKTFIHEKAIASQVGIFCDEKEFSSLLIFYAYSNNININSEILLNEFIEIIYNKIDINIISDSFNKIKNQLLMDYYKELEIIPYLTTAAAKSALYFDNPHKIIDAINKYDSITADDIFNFIREKMKIELSNKVIIRVKK